MRRPSAYNRRMASVPIFTAYGDATPFVVELTPIGTGNASLRIEADFAGREVEEELPIEILERLAGEEPFDYDDLLGLGLKTDGQKIHGLIGIGSGNEKFNLQREDLGRALAEIS